MSKGGIFVIIKVFGKWETNVHEEAEQKKRISAALSICDSNVVFLNDTCKILGSSSVPYIVTLNSCSCRDFLTRKKPCKHIYYFAIKSGFIDNETVDKCKAEYPYTSSYSKNERQKINKSAFEELEKLSDSAQRKLYSLLYEYIYHKADEQKIDSEKVELFTGCDLVLINEASFAENLSFMKIADIKAIIKETGKKSPAKLKKSELCEWCIENTPELEKHIPHYYKLNFNPKYKTSHRKIYSYLKNTYFPNDCIL